MSLTSLLRTLNPRPKRPHARGSQLRRFRPQLELLENRQLLTSFLVVLGTDNGGPAGQKVTATSGDLRYCIEQADAAHTATSDSIGFSSLLTSTPHTITLNGANGPLVLSDSHPLTINGPAAHTLNISGGGQVEVFAIVSGTVIMKNLAIIYGKAALGGGIFNQGTLTLTNCFLHHDSATDADPIVGPGLVMVDNYGNAFPQIVVDRTNPQTFAAGFHVAGPFNYQFSDMFPTSHGSVTPLLLTFDGTNYTPVAVGAPVTFTGPTGFISTPFGGSDTFNLATSTTIYAGFYWSDPGGTPFTDTNPIEFTDTTGSCFILAASSPGVGGANPPVVGTPISGGSPISATRAYDFSIGAGNADGGGICNQGTLTLTSCFLDHDSAATNGGSGGGIFNGGGMTLTSCTLSNDSAGPGGGGIFNQGTLAATNCFLDHDSAGGLGGGMGNTGTVTLTSCTFYVDSANDGGGINNFDGGTARLTKCTLSNDSALGGGGMENLYGGAATLTSCTLSNDTAYYGGGFFNVGSGTVNLSNCNLTNDRAFAIGGGIYNYGTVILTNSTLNNDSGGGDGGGVFNFAGATATLTSCTLSNDTASISGGGISNLGTATLTNCTLSNDSSKVIGSSTGYGGGVFNGVFNGSLATASLTNCTLSNDSAYLNGGGIYTEGAATLTNCTVANDSALSYGGGIANANGGTATITNCTLSLDSAQYGGGISNGATLNLINTIVAGNTATSSGPDVLNDGSITADHDLIGDGSASLISNGGGNIVGGNGNPVIDARLVPLGNYGGPTQTMPLDSDSPAIGHADNSQAPLTDQRGIKRIDQSGETTDIGAFERKNFANTQLLTTFLVVLGTDNGGPGGQMVTATSGDLRYCIEQADAAHTATADSISFSSALTSTPHTITLNSANGPLVLSDSNPLTIDGPTSHNLNISGGGQVEVFDITSGTVSINNLIIMYGNAANGNGGGISNQGTLTLTTCFLDHDSASNDGGGIFNAGTATLTGCSLYLDSASGAGGGISNYGGTATLTNCILSNDSALSGGGIDNTNGNANGTATLTNCTLSNDTAAYFGGGLANDEFGSGVGTVTLSNCTLSNDRASISGGGIWNALGATVTLASCALSDDSSASSGGGIDNGVGSTATLTNSTLNDNSASSDGGGINNVGTVTLNNCTLSNDFAASTSAGQGGGGMINWTGATATLTNCTLSNDTASTDGGGIDNQGTATLSSCTLSNNSASINGGGAYNEGTAALTNCTLANDSAGSYGGGIANANVPGTATLTNCTLSLNSAQYGGGISNGATLNLINTIVAGNTASTSGPDILNDGTITADHDLIGDGTSSGISNGGGNIVGGNGNPVIDARLGPLQNNGGPTETMALLSDSPAIGHADNSMAPATDQRGITRIDELGETTDIGAFET